MSTEKLWGGRFTQDAQKWVQEYGASITFDQEMAAEDIEGSLAHVAMLKHCQIISAEDADKITAGLESLAN